jgi:hypothetical protein
MASIISWFQIPATDIARARRFFETVCAVELEQLPATPGMDMWAFPADPRLGEIGGALVCGAGAVPGATGTMVFLDAEPDLQAMLDRVEPAGGRILIPRTAIGMDRAGYFAVISDTEGNTIGLHSRG